MSIIKHDNFKVQELKIETEGDHSGATVQEKTDCQFGKGEDTLSLFYLRVTLLFNGHSLTNSFYIRSKISIDFILPPKPKLNENGVYECVRFAGESLQNAIKEAFIGKKAKPTIKLPSLSELYPSMTKILNGR